MGKKKSKKAQALAPAAAAAATQVMREALEDRLTALVRRHQNFNSPPFLDGFREICQTYSANPHFLPIRIILSRSLERQCFFQFDAIHRVAEIFRIAIDAGLDIDKGLIQPIACMLVENLQSRSHLRAEQEEIIESLTVVCRKPELGYAAKLDPRNYCDALVLMPYFKELELAKRVTKILQAGGGSIATFQAGQAKTLLNQILNPRVPLAEQVPAFMQFLVDDCGVNLNKALGAVGVGKFLPLLYCGILDSLALLEAYIKLGGSLLHRTETNFNVIFYLATSRNISSEIMRKVMGAFVEQGGDLCECIVAGTASLMAEITCNQTFLSVRTEFFPSESLSSNRRVMLREESLGIYHTTTSGLNLSTILLSSDIRMLKRLLEEGVSANEYGRFCHPLAILERLRDVNTAKIMMDLLCQYGANPLMMVWQKDEVFEDCVPIVWSAEDEVTEIKATKSLEEHEVGLCVEDESSAPAAFPLPLSPAFAPTPLAHVIRIPMGSNAFENIRPVKSGQKISELLHKKYFSSIGTNLSVFLFFLKQERYDLIAYLLEKRPGYFTADVVYTRITEASLDKTTKIFILLNNGPMPLVRVLVMDIVFMDAFEEILKYIKNSELRNRLVREAIAMALETKAPPEVISRLYTIAGEDCFFTELRQRISGESELNVNELARDVCFTFPLLDAEILARKLKVLLLLNETNKLEQLSPENFFGEIPDVLIWEQAFSLNLSRKVFLWLRDKAGCSFSGAATGQRSFAHFMMRSDRLELLDLCPDEVLNNPDIAKRTALDYAFQKDDVAAVSALRARAAQLGNTGNVVQVIVGFKAVKVFAYWIMHHRTEVEAQLSIVIAQALEEKNHSILTLLAKTFPKGVYDYIKLNPSSRKALIHKLGVSKFVKLLLQRDDKSLLDELLKNNLLDFRDDIFSKKSLLYRAVELGGTQCVRFLAERFSDQLKQPCTEDHWLPLHCAVIRQHAEIVTTLARLDLDKSTLERGDAFGKTPEDYAREADDNGILEIFERLRPPTKPVTPTHRIFSTTDYYSSSVFAPTVQSPAAASAVALTPVVTTFSNATRLFQVNFCLQALKESERVTLPPNLMQHYYRFYCLRLFELMRIANQNIVRSCRHRLRHHYEAISVYLKLVESIQRCGMRMARVHDFSAFCRRSALNDFVQAPLPDLTLSERFNVLERLKSDYDALQANLKEYKVTITEDWLNKAWVFSENGNTKLLSILLSLLAEIGMQFKIIFSQHNMHYPRWLVTAIELGNEMAHATCMKNVIPKVLFLWKNLSLEALEAEMNGVRRMLCASGAYLSNAAVAVASRAAAMQHRI